MSAYVQAKKFHTIKRLQNTGMRMQNQLKIGFPQLKLCKTILLTSKMREFLKHQSPPVLSSFNLHTEMIRANKTISMFDIMETQTLIYSGKAFTKGINKRGSSADPSGTPIVAGYRAKLYQTIIKTIHLSVKNFEFLLQKYEKFHLNISCEYYVTLMFSFRFMFLQYLNLEDIQNWEYIVTFVMLLHMISKEHSMYSRLDQK